MRSNQSKESEFRRHRLHLLDELCDEFERLWKTGVRPDIADFLDTHRADLDDELVEELVRIDLEFLKERTPELDPDEYAEQFSCHRSAVQRMVRRCCTEESDLPTAGGLTDAGNRYQIDTQIGSGGMGKVYRAVDVRLNRPVALKMIRADLSDSPRVVDRFRREAETIAKLVHENVVAVYDVGKIDGQVCIALELVTGGNLSEVISNRPQSPEYAATILRTVAQAVAYAHRKRIIHRDLKPSNVLMTEDGDPKVADFGLAKLMSSDQPTTRTGDLMGTANYMAPEQALGQQHRVDERTDVYGLGSILYEMLTGRAPFQGRSSWDTVQQLLTRDPATPRMLQPSIPADIETICLKCLQKEENRRYQSATEVANDLDRFLDGRPIIARRIGPVARFLKLCARYKAISATVAISALAILVISIVSVFNIIRQRDLARENLFDSLVSSARANLKSDENDWWYQAGAHFDQAAPLRPADRDGKELRELAIAWMGAESPYFQLSHTLKTGNLPVRGVGFRPNTGQAVVATQDGTLILWDLEADQPVVRRHLDRNIKSVLVRPASDQIVIHFEDGALALHEMSRLLNVDDAILPESVLQASKISCIQFDRAGKFLVAGTVNGKVYIWDANHIQLAPRVVHAAKSAITCVDFSGRKDLLFFGTKAKRIASWDMVNNELNAERRYHVVPTVLTLAVNEDEICWADVETFGFARMSTDRLTGSSGFGNVCDGSVTQLLLGPGGWTAVASADGTLRIFAREESATQLAMATAEHGAVRALAGDLAKGALIAGYGDGSAIVWRVKTSPFRYTHVHRDHWCASANQTPTFFSAYYVTSRMDLDAGISKVDLSTWLHDGNVWGIAVSPDDKQLATAAHDGTCAVWNADDGELVRQIETGWGIAWSASFSHDGQWLAFGGDELMVADAKTLEIVMRYNDHQNMVCSVQFHPNSRWLFSSSLDGTVRVWDVSGRLPSKTLLGNKRPVRSLAVRPDGQQLAAACGDSRVVVWPLMDPTTDSEATDWSWIGQLASIRAYPGAVHSVAYSNDGRWLASGSERGALFFHDPESLAEIVRFKNGSGQIRSIAFTPENRYMAATVYARDMFVWDLHAVRQKLASLNVDWRD